MKLIKTLIGAAAIALVSAGAANAGTLGVTNAAVTIWNFTSNQGLYGAGSDALPTNPLLSGNQVYSGTYTGPINFTDVSSSNDIATFLGSAGGTFSGSIASLSADTLSTGFSGNTGIVTIMELTVTLGSKTLLDIFHDDGVSVFDSTNTTNFMPGAYAPTSYAETLATVNAGTYNIWYSEVNGLPADLIVLGTSLQDTPVPEPLTLSLFGAGLVGAASMRRRKKPA